VKELTKYTLEDLDLAVSNRKFHKEELNKVLQSIRVEDAKLKSLKDDEAQISSKLEAANAQVLVIASKLGAL
jgi:hypothetical protein